MIIGTPERFPCGKRIGSYIGLIPSEDPSAGWQGANASFSNSARPCSLHSFFFQHLFPFMMIRALHEEHEFSDRFITYMLARNIRVEEDLIDQLFNSSEKRLARTLLLARFGGEGPAGTLVA